MRELAAKEIGARIAQARRESGGMTQEELAELLGVRARTVQLYEAGDVIPWRYFERMGEIFERSLGWFLHGEEEAQVATQLSEANAEILERLARLEEGIEELLRERREAREVEPPPAQAAEG